MSEDYRNKWERENRARLIVIVKPDERDKIKSRAESLGESVNAYIKRLIDNDLNAENDTSAPQGTIKIKALDIPEP